MPEHPAQTPGRSEQMPLVVEAGPAEGVVLSVVVRVSVDRSAGEPPVGVGTGDTAPHRNPPAPPLVHPQLTGAVHPQPSNHPHPCRSTVRFDSVEVPPPCDAGPTPRRRPLFPTFGASSGLRAAAQRAG